MREVSIVQGYHAHVYYGAADGRRRADTLRQDIAARFAVSLGHVHDVPVGPHPLPMYQVSFAVDQFATFVPWLMLNRQGLDILVHPVTGDDLSDHRDGALWLGRSLTLNLGFFPSPRLATEAPATAASSTSG